MAYKGLASVQFGAIAAEDEVDLLQNYFLETREFSQITSSTPSKLLVTGRKGSGKSAIYLAIKNIEATSSNASPEPVQDATATYDLVQLLNYSFSIDELVRLSSSLQMGEQYLDTSGKYVMALELVRYAERRGRLPQLIQICMRERPNIDWHNRQSLPSHGTYDAKAIRKALLELFSLEELQDLAFSLNVDWDNIVSPSQSLGSASLGLVIYLQRRGRLGQLVDEIVNQRPVLKESHFFLPTYIEGSDEISGKSDNVVPATEPIMTIKAEPPQYSIMAYTLLDYPWEKHKEVVDTGVAIEYCYVNSWEYVIWVLMSKVLLNYDVPVGHISALSMGWRQRWLNGNVRFLRRFLKQNYGTIAPNFVELLADKARNIRSLKVKDLAVDSDSSGTDAIRLSKSINVINQALQSRVLTVLPSDVSFYILFDQLDLGWDGTEQSKRLLTGLLLAGRRITNAAKSSQRDIRVITFLRSDIFEALKFEDKNKYWQAVGIELTWDRRRLQDLISRRIDASAGGTWYDVFALDNKVSTPLLDAIVKHTMWRPRDMIQLCSLAREAALKASRETIDLNSLNEALEPYSDYMRREIQDECVASFPEIDHLFDILSEIGSAEVSYDKLGMVCKERGFVDPDAMTRKLIELSVLGLKHASGCVFRYQQPHWKKMDPTEALVIHPSLTRVLGIL